MKIQPQQNRILHALLNSSCMIAYKLDMIEDVTKGRATSSKDLTSEEAQLLINHLKTLDQKSSAEEKMRRKIISMAHEIGWRKLVDGKYKIDMDSVNSWCNKFSFGKKPLNDFSYVELPKLVTQFENGPYKHYLNNI